MESPHFKDAELACHHCGLNECRQELLDALEAFRAIVGRPVQVDDAYRCPTHNASAAVGGARNSQHVLGLAADIRVPGMSPREMYLAALQVPAFRTGGIGVDEHKGYIHVDVRVFVARWCYDRAGKTCAWDSSLDTGVVLA